MGHTPDILRRLDTDGITRRGENFGNLQIANDDILLLQHEETNSLEG
jgi:hypothetical protein